MRKQKSECWLKRKGPLKHRQCCCVCKWHIQDNYHCTTAMPLRKEIEKMVGGSHCICGLKKGWICLAPEFSEENQKIAYSDWPEHSIGCEMFDKRETPSIIS